MTAQELKQLARNYQNVASALVEFRKAHPNETEGDKFTRLIGDLVKSADETMNRAVELALVDFEVSAKELRDATEEAAGVVKVVGDVTNVLSIAGAVAGLAACVLHPTPGGVARALKSLAVAIPKPAAQSSPAAE